MPLLIRAFRAFATQLTLQRIMRTSFGALFLALMAPVAAWSGTLSTPSITAPTTGSTVSGTTPTLSWTSVSNANTYRVQVGTSATFDTSTDGQTCYNCVMNSKLSSTSTVASGLSAGTTYYWRVRAGNTDANSGWSESSWATGSFTTSVAQSTLSTPSITAPTTGSTVSGTTPTLSWTSVSNADTYRVQVGTSATFDSSTNGQTCNNCVMNSKLSSTSTAASGLSAGTTYYWRVRAGNTDANSGWTESSWATGSFVTSAGTTPPPQTSSPLNDTGITFCGDASTNTANCATVAADGGTYPRQDARYGRDAQAAAGSLTKVGGGGKGFDFTKIANNGSVLPASATLGSGATDWACTRDNVTGLIWEVKTTSGLRSQSHRYTWYNSDAAVNGGSVGIASGGSCATNGRCDTEKFVQDVNAAGLCGASDWRMPTVKELGGIVDFGRVNPAIDPDYFPNTPDSLFWSGSPTTYSSNHAWDVSNGGAGNPNRSSNGVVRLVRGGQ